MPLKNKKVLVTYGPTWIAIDSVRVISNISTGTMGRALIGELKKKKARITVLEGPVQHPLNPKNNRIKKFVYFNELNRLLGDEIKKKYAFVIHAAAVSDYRVKNPSRKKLLSDKKGLRLTLEATPKIINRIKKHAPATFLVGFKLETSPGKGARALAAKARALMKKNGCDMVVANAVRPNGGYTGLIIDPQKRILARANSRAETARKLVNLLDHHL